MGGSKKADTAGCSKYASIVIVDASISIQKRLDKVRSVNTGPSNKTHALNHQPTQAMANEEQWSVSGGVFRTDKTDVGKQTLTNTFKGFEDLGIVSKAENSRLIKVLRE